MAEWLQYIFGQPQGRSSNPGSAILSTVGMYVTGLTSWVDTKGSPVSSLKCDRQQITSLAALCDLLLSSVPLPEGGRADQASQGSWSPAWNWSRVI